MKPIFDEKLKMNKTEQRYAGQLQSLKIVGKIVDYYFEGMKFRLGQGAYYTPDFFIVCHEHFEIHEIKGYWREAAKVRMKTAAELYPYFKWRAVYWENKQWSYEEF